MERDEWFNEQNVMYPIFIERFIVGKKFEFVLMKTMV
jgi:hypothetical protein